MFLSCRGHIYHGRCCWKPILGNNTRTLNLIFLDVLLAVNHQSCTYMYTPDNIHVNIPVVNHETIVTSFFDMPGCCTEVRAVASQCVQQRTSDKATERGHKARPKSSGARPVSVASSFPQSSLLLGFYLRKKLLATLAGRAPELCGRALWPGSVFGPCPPLVLVLAAPLSVARLRVRALSSSCPCPGRAPVSGPALCPGLVLLLSLS